MGKSLVIKKADFSQASVGIVIFDERNFIDFGLLTRENYFTSGGSYVDTPSCYFIQSGSNKFGVVANGTNVSGIMFLKSKPASASDPIDRCDMTQMEYWSASSKLLSVPAGVQAVWDIPADCNYIYIASLTERYGDYTPAQAWFE